MKLADGSVISKREPSITLQKAIEIAEIEEASDFAGITYDYEDAIKLLIEAGKHTMRIRSDKHYDHFKRLPGETEE